MQVPFCLPLSRWTPLIRGTSQLLTNGISKSWKANRRPTWTQNNLMAGENWMQCSSKTKRTFSINSIGPFKIMQMIHKNRLGKYAKDQMQRRHGISLKCQRIGWSWTAAIRMIPSMEVRMMPSKPSKLHLEPSNRGRRRLMQYRGKRTLWI